MFLFFHDLCDVCGGSQGSDSKGLLFHCALMVEGNRSRLLKLTEFFCSLCPAVSSLLLTALEQKRGPVLHVT